MKAGNIKIDRLITILLTLVLTLSNTSIPTFALGNYIPGSYSGSAMGRNGLLSLDVVVDEGGLISKIEIGDNKETVSYLNKAMAVISQIIERQSVEGVDAVSGATLSSRAILNATSAALALASSGIFASGDGTESSPYIINTEHQLKAFRNSVNDGETYAGQFIQLGDSITLTENWIPIGTDSINFTGTFNGDGYVINKLVIGDEVIPADMAYAGFFHTLGSTAIVKNLGLTDVEIYAATSSQTRAGALAARTSSGNLNGGSIIDNCYVIGKAVSSRTNASAISYAGGLIAQSGSYTTITNSYTDILVKTESISSNAPYVGGLIAVSSANNLIANCYTLGNVEAISLHTNVNTGVYAGGIVGMQSGFLYNCYSNGDILVSNVDNIEYTAVGAISGQLIKTNAGIDTVFYNTEANWSVGGQGRAPSAVGYGNINASNTEPINPLGYTAEQMKSDILALSLNEGVKNIGDASFSINIPSEVKLFGWEYLNEKVVLTGTPYVDGDIDTSIFASGSGTESDPYMLSTEEQLRAFAVSLRDAQEYTDTYIKLQNDISLSSEAWIPIGEGEYAFDGIFDGGNHIISGLTYDSDGTVKDASEGLYIGFVGVLTGTIKNLGITDVNIRAVGKSSVYAGAIAGATQTSNALIDNSYATGEIYCETLINGNNFAGGIVGYLGTGGHIVNTWSDIFVSSIQGGTAWAESGGITAMNNRGFILNCYTLGNVYAYADRALEAGIVTGNIAAMQAGTVVNSYSLGDLETGDWTQYVGAVFGNTAGIGKGYFLYYNNNAFQSINGQIPTPTIGVGATAKTIDEYDGVTILSGFNYELAGYAKSYIESQEFAYMLNNNFGKFPIEQLPERIKLKTWEFKDGIVKHSSTDATLVYEEVIIYDDTPAAFVAGEYWGRNDIQTVMVKISVTNDVLSDVILVSPTDISGSTALIEQIKNDPAMIYTIDVGDDSNLLDLRNAIAVALEKAKIGDIAGYGTANAIQIFDSGDGTEINPYKISNETQLRAFAASINEDESFDGKYIKISNDIILNGEWIPAGGGNGVYPFSGVLDGGGYTISNITIGSELTPSQYRFAAFIGYSDAMTIKNLNLSDVYINNTYNGIERAFSGAFTGAIDRISYVDSCSATGEINNTTTGTNANYVGGITGSTSGSGDIALGNGLSVFITNTYSDININAVSYNGWVYSGGIVGATNRTYMINCYSLGDINGRSGRSETETNLNKVAAAGLVGFNGGFIYNSYAMGSMRSISPASDIGGVIGRHTGIAIADSVYFNTDTQHWAGSSQLTSNVGYGYILENSIIKNLVGKTANEMKNMSFAEFLNNNLEIIDFPEFDELASIELKNWTYDDVLGIVTFEKTKSEFFEINIDQNNLAISNNTLFGNLKVTVTNNDYDVFEKPAVIIMTLYDNKGVLIHSETKNILLGTDNVILFENLNIPDVTSYTGKVLLWNSLSSMQPIANPSEF